MSECATGAYWEDTPRRTGSLSPRSVWLEICKEKHSNDIQYDCSSASVGRGIAAVVPDLDRVSVISIASGLCLKGGV